MQSDITTPPAEAAPPAPAETEKKDQPKDPAPPAAPAKPVVDVVTKQVASKEDKNAVAVEPGKQEKAPAKEQEPEKPAKPQKASGPTGAIVFALLVCTALIAAAVYMQMMSS